VGTLITAAPDPFPMIRGDLLTVKNIMDPSTGGNFVWHGSVLTGYWADPATAPADLRNGTDPTNQTSPLLTTGRDFLTTPNTIIYGDPLLGGNVWGGILSVAQSTGVVTDANSRTNAPRTQNLEVNF
jgi:hypothetical protein